MLSPLAEVWNKVKLRCSQLQFRGNACALQVKQLAKHCAVAKDRLLKRLLHRMCSHGETVWDYRKMNAAGGKKVAARHNTTGLWLCQQHWLCHAAASMSAACHRVSCELSAGPGQKHCRGAKGEQGKGGQISSPSMWVITPTTAMHKATPQPFRSVALYPQCPIISVRTFLGQGYLER